MGDAKHEKEDERHRLRLLKLLSKNEASGFQYTQMQDKYLISANSKQYTFTVTLVDEQIRRGYIRQSARSMVLTPNGVEKLKSLLLPDMSPYPDTKMIEVKVSGVKQSAMLNIAESPLSRLYFRRDKNGVSFISEEEFTAGERLRQDFEKAQLQPKITASLDTTIGGKGAIDASDISDFAIDARARVYKALDCLGPELTSVTLDICCFLKGLEYVERERNWPRRSAKLMLKTGLSMLVRHYGLGQINQGKRQQTQFWGTSDYKPDMMSRHC